MLGALKREHSFVELDSPTTTTKPAIDFGLRAPRVGAAVGAVCSGVMRVVCWVKNVSGRRAGGAAEGRSRLSVIGELDEASLRMDYCYRGGKEAARGEHHQLLRDRASSAMVNVKWWWKMSRVNIRNRTRPAGPSPCSGVLVIMTDVEPTKPRMAVIHNRYPV